MLDTTNTPTTTTSARPKAASAESGGHVVSFFGRITCPHCGDGLRPSDFEVRPEGEFLICGHCHQDVMTVTAS